MKITITREAGGHAVGDTIELSDSAATHLVDAGYAEKAKANAKVTATSDDDDSSDSDESTTSGRAKRS